MKVVHVPWSQGTPHRRLLTVQERNRETNLRGKPQELNLGRSFSWAKQVQLIRLGGCRKPQAQQTKEASKYESSKTIRHPLNTIAEGFIGAVRLAPPVEGTLTKY